MIILFMRVDISMLGFKVLASYDLAYSTFMSMALSDAQVSQVFFLSCPGRSDRSFKQYNNPVFNVFSRRLIKGMYCTSCPQYNQ